MSTTRITRPRITRAPHDAPLSLAAIEAAAPAVFQEEAFSSMSSRYEYIPTITVLQALMDEGYTCHEVAQSRPYKRHKEPFVKHMLRLRAPSALHTDGEVVPEIVLINSHDGTSQYQLIGGLYRFICCNGLMAGDTFTSLIVRHTGFGTAQRVIEGSYSIVKDTFPKLLETRKAMLQKMLTRDEQILFAHRALALRYPDTLPPFGASLLLDARRPEDEGDDVWHVMNRVQENLLEGGFAGKGNGVFRRNLTVRPVQRVGALASINRNLFNAAVAVL